MPMPWWGRSVLYQATQPSSSSWASSSEAKTLPERNSLRTVLWKRSTLPVVVGEKGAVRR